MRTALTALAAATLSILPGFGAPPQPSVSEDGVWQVMDDAPLAAAQPVRWIVPDRYTTVHVDSAALHSLLDRAPMEFTDAAAGTRVVMTIPMPDGTFARFSINESPIMEPALAAKFPEIRTYSGQGVDDPTMTVRFDWTDAGFHAMILAPSRTIFVDPYSRGDIEHYISYDKKDYHRNGPIPTCLLQDDAEPLANIVGGSAAPGVAVDLGGSDAGSSTVSGTITGPQLAPVGPTLRRYRAAVAADGEYTTFHGGTVANGLSAVTTSVNRVTGVYERDLAIRLILVANENLIIYTNSATDPYTDSSPSTLLTQNQANLDSVIGTANYDIGHVFTTGGGGLSSLGVVCVGGSKARSETGSPTPIGDGYDIDYVAHEMGHQFGGRHTFNGTTSNCGGGNRSAVSAYEVGSGSTIMAYAGICGAEDLQPHSDDYFHTRSYDEITNFVLSTGACSSNVATGNQAPVVNAGPSFTIPINTPFTLTGSATDPDGDPLTYCWEEFDLGTAAPPNTDDGSRPIFRSFNPTSSPSRTFPKLTDILNNTSTFGESLPITTRTMTFRLSARDNRANGGGADYASTTVSSTTAAGPFVVTAPNTAVTWVGNGTQTVTWNVAGTSGAPVNTANVKISLSTDAGNSFPTVLAASTPNDGSQAITVPNTPTNFARVKVEAVGNIYFDISNTNFQILPDTGLPNLSLGTISAIPVGADGDAFIEPHEAAKLSLQVVNNGTVAATSVSGVLTSSTPGVTVISNQAIPYPNLPAGGNGTNTQPYFFTVGPGVACGANLSFTLTVSYAEGGPAAFNFTVPTGEPVTTNFPYLGAAISIPDNNAAGVNATILVSGLTGTTSDVNLTFEGSSCTTGLPPQLGVGVDHSWVGDFVAKITSPTASAVTLLSRPGGVNNSGHNFCRTTLDDSAASSIQAITAAGQPYTGSFIPFSPLTAFNGQNPNGTWTLNISDQAAADTGNLRAWSLSIRTLACNAPLPGPGTVPSAAPSTPLTVAKSGSNVTLAWGASCSSSGVDYAIYQGTIGTFTSHASKFCSTQGLLSKTFSMDPGNLYYLVTALTAEREGSYGQATSGERPAAASPCKPQLLGACP